MQHDRGTVLKWKHSRDPSGLGQKRMILIDRKERAGQEVTEKQHVNTVRQVSSCRCVRQTPDIIRFARELKRQYLLEAVKRSTLWA